MCVGVRVCAYVRVLCVHSREHVCLRDRACVGVCRCVYRYEWVGVCVGICRYT